MKKFFQKKLKNIFGVLTLLVFSAFVFSAQATWMTSQHGTSNKFRHDLQNLCMDWDNTPGNGADNDGGGIWDDTTQNWTGSDGRLNIQWVRDTLACFGQNAGAAGTVNVSGAKSASGLIFRDATSGQYSINGGSISSKYANLLIDTDTSTSPTISSILFGTSGLEKIGDGEAILTSANTYSGNTEIDAGTLQVGDAGTTGVLGTGEVHNNAVLEVRRYDADLNLSTVIPHADGVQGSGRVDIYNDLGRIILNRDIEATTEIDIVADTEGIHIPNGFDADGTTGGIKITGENTILNDGAGGHRGIETAINANINFTGDTILTGNVHWANSWGHGVWFDAGTNLTTNGDLEINGLHKSNIGNGIYLRQSTINTVGGDLTINAESQLVSNNGPRGNYSGLYLNNQSVLNIDGNLEINATGRRGISGNDSNGHLDVDANNVTINATDLGNNWGATFENLTTIDANGNIDLNITGRNGLYYEHTGMNMNATGDINLSATGTNGHGLYLVGGNYNITSGTRVDLTGNNQGNNTSRGFYHANGEINITAPIINITGIKADGAHWGLNFEDNNASRTHNFNGETTITGQNNGNDSLGIFLRPTSIVSTGGNFTLSGTGAGGVYLQPSITTNNDFIINGTANLNNHNAVQFANNNQVFTVGGDFNISATANLGSGIRSANDLSSIVTGSALWEGTMHHDNNGLAGVDFRSNRNMSFDGDHRIIGRNNSTSNSNSWNMGTYWDGNTTTINNGTLTIEGHTTRGRSAGYGGLLVRSTNFQGNGSLVLDGSTTSTFSGEPGISFDGTTVFDNAGGVHIIGDADTWEGVDFDQNNNGNFTFNVPVKITGTSQNNTWGIFVHRPFTINDELTIEDVNGGSHSRLDNTISGTGGLVKSGDGQLHIYTAGKTYTGGTRIEDGEIYIGANTGNVMTDQLLGARDVEIQTNGTLVSSLHSAGNDNIYITNDLINGDGTVSTIQGVTTHIGLSDYMLHVNVGDGGNPGANAHAKDGQLGAGGGGTLSSPARPPYYGGAGGDGFALLAFYDNTDTFISSDIILASNNNYFVPVGAQYAEIWSVGGGGAGPTSDGGPGSVGGGGGGAGGTAWARVDLTALGVSTLNITVGNGGARGSGQTGGATIVSFADVIIRGNGGGGGRSGWRSNNCGRKGIGGAATVTGTTLSSYIIQGGDGGDSCPSSRGGGGAIGNGDGSGVTPGTATDVQDMSSILATINLKTTDHGYTTSTDGRTIAYSQGAFGRLGTNVLNNGEITANLPSSVTSYDTNALSLSAVTSKIIFDTDGSATISNVVNADSITAASGFTVDIIGALDPGTYTLISCTGALPATLPTLGTNSTGNTVNLQWTPGTGLEAVITP